MTEPSLVEIERHLAEKNRRIEECFRDRRMREGVDGFYTEDVRYLTPEFQLLRGRNEVTTFLEEIRAQFSEVRLYPTETLGDPAGRRVVLQFANVQLRPADGGEMVDAHYVACFRPVGNQWLCEMEAPAFGKMTHAGDRS
jgi:hypothetical protein